MNKEVINVKVEEIIPNTYQPRKFFDNEALMELAQSIKEQGIIQPLTVRKMGEYYELVAGERRLRAAKIANLSEVPCILVDISDIQSAQIALLENLQREDLSFVEEAEAYYSLINDHKFTQEEIAKKMGKKQSTIANKLRILKLPKKIREICTENNLTERHARALLKIKEEKDQLRIVKRIIKNKLNVKESEELINNELLKIAGKQLNGKKGSRIKTVFPAKMYVNTIKQVFDKFSIPAKYDFKDNDEYIEIKVKIPKKNK
ncbi:ParB/RepB/Spo0J family partition protein [Clostridium sp. HCP1S3_B4]|uniref:ParB/RepB/Spo0J family partition protein n=1 Tax=unclassified Clostridium TaxID=2614128 RepID=UPI0016A19F18|nr:ParB/RepB/Spo0J family partition protein [Clostridiales bacterium]MDY2729837.1 ParB/RepB/Spo0J family partition protein [Clostridium sp.]NLK23579.1 ParB/RepB/Spo0J family partition protein [Clostridiales bacterium]